jgi:hypothetical protein
MMHDGWMRRKAIVRDPFSVGFKFDTHLISKFPPPPASTKVVVSYIYFYFITLTFYTGPEHIYNSHYGNGVPAIFTF